LRTRRATRDREARRSPRPTGGPEVAHQIITNTGTTTMRYLALSTLVDIETCEDPDSQKVLVRENVDV
jgi:uncharacterized cupin superfamily protein